MDSSQSGSMPSRAEAVAASLADPVSKYGWAVDRFGGEVFLRSPPRKRAFLLLWCDNEEEAKRCVALLRNE